MARTASLTPTQAMAACIQAYGERNAWADKMITSDNRKHVKAWLVAEGIPSAYVSTLTLDTLRAVYADSTNATLAAMRATARNSQQDLHGMSADFVAIDELDADQDEPAQQTVTPANATEASKKLAEALAMIASLQGPGKLDESRVREIVREHLHITRDELITMMNQRASAPLVIEVRRDGDLVGRVEGRHHPMFTTLLKAASARDASGHVPNIWITGPAGSGKTRAVSDCCKALGIGFEHNGALSMPHELVGFIDAAGKFHETAFTRAYDAACGYLFDEVDGSDNAALLSLNAALANGHASLPKGVIERHKDNRIFVAANTWGHGATAEYVGRAKLDAAFLDRFPVKIHFDYDEELERDICGNPDWARRVQAARAKARAAGLKVAITPRASIGGAALIASGFSMEQAANMTYMATLTPEQRRQVAA